MKRGSSSIKRTIIYKEEEYNNSECDKVLEDLNVAYFSNVIFSMQDEGDITKMKPSARADLLSRLLEFDFTEKVKKLTEYISELKEKASDNNSQISFNEDLIKEKKNQIKEVPLFVLSKILGRDRDLIDINFAVADFLGIKATSDYHDDKIRSVDDIKKIIDKKDFTKYREYNVDGDAWDVVEYIGDDRLADKEHIYKSIIEIYEPDNFNFDIITNKDIDSYSNIEAWFSGECVAIRYDEWKEIKDIL
jgi:hypothetical protein